LADPLHLRTGLVLRSTGSFYRVRQDETGQLRECTLRGKFRLKGYNTTNPLAVGDRVDFEPDGDNGGTIIHLHDRRNYILRRATRSHAQVQILCANVDQAVFVATLKQPFTPIGYIDSFMAMCEAYRIPAVVVFNKVDLLDKDRDWAKLKDLGATYEAAGYTTYGLSIKSDQTEGLLHQIFDGKVSFVAGPSGAGKSSLINLLDPNLQLRTAELTVHSQKGRHTTTFAELFPLEGGGAVIDAPGFSEFGVVGLERAELSHYFPEFRALLGQCRYHNCLHVAEPGCVVRQAVEEDRLPATRYHSYISILEGIPKSAYDNSQSR